MSFWRFSDGTTLEGSHVRGGSAFAAKLRSDLEAMAQGHQFTVAPYPQPSPSVDLDMSDDWLVASWVLPIATRHKVEVVERPALVAWEPPDAPSDDPPGAVY